MNGAGALALAQAIDPRVPVGSNWLVKGVTEASVIDGQTITWAKNIVWGTSELAGSAIYAHLAAWDPTTWGSNIVWGTNIVWGDLSASNIVWGNTLVSVN